MASIPEQLAEQKNKVPQVYCLPHHTTGTCTYIVVEPKSREAAIVDPVYDFTPENCKMTTTHADSLLAFIKEHMADITLKYIIETHVHADHLTGARYLKEKLGGTMVIGKQVTKVQETFAKLYNISKEELPTDGSHFDALTSEDSKMALGDVPVRVIPTPGHTPACCSYLIGDAVFTGDTLFAPDIGTARVDFPGGSADEMYESCHKLFALPETTRNFIGHDYPGDRRPFQWCWSIAEQKASNKQIKVGTSKEEYTAARLARDATLNAPRLLLPSLHLNIRAGHLPEPEDNGISYIKLPINQLK